jgi:GNAT superfamily N-acetyltransferase
LSDQLIIRPVVPSDFPEWKPLWDGYNAFYGRFGATALAPTITEATWSRFFDPNEPVHAIVAESSGKLLGLAHFLFHRSTISINPVCYMQDLFTIEAARGRGVGRSLIASVYDRAKAAGSGRVYWHTQHSNDVARSLYDKVADNSGFIVYRKDLTD